MDCEWILEAIYNNNLINLTTDALNLSDVYKNEIIVIGEKDASRIKRLEELEVKIGNVKRYFEYDYQLIEDSLESAILTRMLEKPKTEVIGKFDRVLRLAKKVNNDQQLSRIYYQRAWTYINWYDDYRNFISEFNNFIHVAEKIPNASTIEQYFNLLNILSVISHRTNDDEEISSINYELEIIKYRNVLDRCILNTAKPSTALIANTYKSLLNIFANLSREEEIANDLQTLHRHLLDSRGHLEYPFEGFKKVIEVFGRILPDNQDYDDLINSVAEISENRASELASAETFLKRGFQKLDNQYYKHSLVYFGKSVRKLAKEESQDYLFFALVGLSSAYSKLGLHWASNNAILAASSIASKELYNQGRISKRFFKCVKDALKHELCIGRIPHLLSWYDLYMGISAQFESESLDEEPIPIPELIDACLAVRLLNSPYDSWKEFHKLPDLLEQKAMWISQDASLYMLGHTDLIYQDHLKNLTTPRTLDEYYNLIANQPFKDQIAFRTELLDAESIEFKSVILGTEFTIKFKKDKEHAIFAEMVLAFLESFLATAFEEVFPSTEEIAICVSNNTGIDWYKIIEKEDSGLYEIQINTLNSGEEWHHKRYDLLFELTSKILDKEFVFKQAKEYLNELFEHDQLYERQSIIFEHRKFFTDILGQDPDIFLTDWMKDNSFKEYEFIRKINPINIEDEPNHKTLENGLKTVRKQKHSQTKVSSIIEMHLWENAKWIGIGCLSTLEVPFGIFLAYKNGDLGRKIFENWILRFGKIDHQEEINVAIIKGVNLENPFWYRVHISKRIDKKMIKDGQTMISASKFHEMQTNNPSNLTKLISGLNQFKEYTLFPASLRENGSIEPFFDLGIFKKQLTVRHAWEIGEHDFDAPVIRSDDNPIIPADKPDAPVIHLLKKKREDSDQKFH